jgi:hypothetical protein
VRGLHKVGGLCISTHCKHQHAAARVQERRQTPAAAVVLHLCRLLLLLQ